ncbi:Jason-like protein [Thalictrum thalictroides]|uniref:Jason-like protein n=1 Tax=Thalictrum thalictroides TaxID=46969 RepID=A0A7J6V288_THATH|nr:Jason-like protein [Thalictrum thalictroides]
MGNFLGCFRVKDVPKRQFPLISDESLSNRREEEVEDNWACKNNLATLFSPPEEEGWSCDSTGFSYRNSDDKEVKAEARFLIACGTLLKSPVEFRKVSEKLEDVPINGGDFGSSEFHSWTPIKKLHWEEQPEWIPVTVAKHCEALEEESGSSERPSTSSLVFEGIDSASVKGSEIEICYLEMETEALYPTCNNTISAVTPVLPSEATRCKSKFVRFKVQNETEPFSSKTGDKNLEQSDSSGSDTTSNKSSYPTPLNISDDMQTPGTIYPSYQKKLGSGKNARVRSQYVHTVLKPIDNFSQWKTLKKADLNAQQQDGHLLQPLEQYGNPNLDTGSVSRANFGGRFHSIISDMDRPILGIVASEWNNDEPPHISDNFLVGNGIPNSTRKYKEDQTVSWHATPFEERLEKALSREILIPQRKPLNGRPIDFDENEECFSC